MAKNLVIVESPAKARTIAKFLGSDYEVESSFGHIRDLPKKGLNIDVENNFKPSYEVSADKKKVVSLLKKAAKNKEVWLASDEDREGEAIAWHLTKALDLDTNKTKRIVFHEITKPAIEAAINNPRTIDIKLVDAQQARRILDRLVGYELSPVLWKKIHSGLSAGRVQSVAVRLIVDREREIRDFQTKSTFKITALFDDPKQEFSAELNSQIEDYAKAITWLEGTKGSDYTISDIAQKPSVRNPGPPFTTSGLQQEASRRLGYSVRQTMTLAQRLYENGDITYMRTDSTLLSQLAISAAEKYITDEYGKQYSKTRQYKTKQAGAQEAHEAIRPTDFKKQSVEGDKQMNNLYRLIWRRALASQMTPAEFERTEVRIDISNKPKEQFIAKGEVLRFDGFIKVYGTSAEDSLLPELKVGQKLKCLKVTATESFSRSRGRYSEASLVRKLEELGIGRPSTYAPTISTVQTRGYVEKTNLEGSERQVRIAEIANGTLKEQTDTVITGADKSKLIPTPVAELTTDFLVEYFPQIVDYDFTAKVEEDFDNIADGKEQWEEMLKRFYTDFHPLVEKTDKISRSDVAKARLLGDDPETGEPVYARLGRFGPLIQRGDAEDKDKKPAFAPLPANTTIDNVTLDQALTMLSLPREVGKTKDGKVITADIGRFGPYIKIEKQFISIKPLDPFTITEKEAIEKYDLQKKKIAERNINEFPGGIKILNGPYGPYVTDGKKNARLSKELDPKKLTEKEAKEILAKKTKYKK
ncbi:MAG: type I DNA topoisomerase [Candidatus Saccharibacteria bacterium]